jgi:hypothetical protein
MAHDEPTSHCYFKRQPETADEIDRACQAVLVSCCGAVQYGGDDPAIEARLSELNLQSAQEETVRRNGQAARVPWWRFW